MDPFGAKDSRARLSLLLRANYPSISLGKDSGDVCKNQHSLTLSPQAGINFLLTPRRAMGAQGSAAGRQTVGLCSAAQAAAVGGVSPFVSSAPAPLPASKSSKAQQAPGLLLEVRGGPGEASGFGKAAAGGSRVGAGSMGRGTGRAGGQQQDSRVHPPACPKLPSPTGMKLSPPHPSPGKALPS